MQHELPAPGPGALPPGAQPQGPAAPADERAGRWQVAVGVSALLSLWLLILGQAPLLDVDEGAFGQASREMLVSGDWGHTTLNGADRFDKPILVYWLQAASLAMLGVSEFALRLPSALCAFALCLATAGFAAPRLGRPVAWSAAALLATMLGPLLIGRAATADSLLNLLLALAAFDLWRFIEGGGTQRAPLRRAAVWIGLGLLTKGPVALLVPGAAVVLWLLLGPRGAPRAALARAAFGDAPAWLLRLSVALPWYGYALHRHGWAFVEGFLLHHNLQRFSGPLEGHRGSLMYYLWVLPLLMLPWSALLVPVLARLRGRHGHWGAAPGRFLLLWAGFVLVFFSLSGTKLPHYVLYGIVPLGLLGAVELQRASRALVLAVVLSALALLALAAAGPDLAGWAAQQRADDHWRARLAAAGADELPAAAQAALALAALGVVALGAWAWRAEPGRHRPAALLGAAALSALSVLAVSMPWWARALQEPVRALALQARDAGVPLVQWRLHQPSAGFYRQQAVPRRAPAPGEWALMRRDRWADLPEAERAGVSLVREDRGFVLLRRDQP